MRSIHHLMEEKKMAGGRVIFGSASSSKAEKGVQA
jgi:hypothetical protein